MTITTTPALAREVWPTWAKALLVGIAMLAVLVALPWVLMLPAMAACMGQLPQMMGPGMMR